VTQKQRAGDMLIAYLQQKHYAIIVNLPNKPRIMLDDTRGIELSHTRQTVKYRMPLFRAQNIRVLFIQYDLIYRGEWDIIEAAIHIFKNVNADMIFTAQQLRSMHRLGILNNTNTYISYISLFGDQNANSCHD